MRNGLLDRAGRSLDGRRALNAPFRTSDLEPKPTDAELASVFRELETPVNFARSAAIVAEMMLNDAWLCGPDVLPSGLRAQLSLGDRYHVLLLTNDQYVAVEHAVRGARDGADALYKAFYAGFEAGGER